MKKSMRKDFRREIKNNFSRFISILLIVVLGVAFFSGIRSASPAMKESADRQFDKQNMMDIRVVGTMGITESDIEAVSKVRGVSNVEGAYAGDFLCLVNSAEVVTKVLSMPKDINEIKLTSGRYPEKYNELLVSREFLDASGLKVGDYMTLTTGTSASVFDTLASETYTIVGICSSSYYLNGDMGTATVGDGTVDGYVVIPKEAFVTDIYSVMYITVAGAKDLNCFSKEYKAKIDKVVKEIEKISEERCDIRYSEVKAQSTEILTKAQNEYTAAKLTAEDELAKAYEELLENEELIDVSRATYEEKKAILENAETELPKRKEEIQKSKDDLEQTKTVIAQLETRLEAARPEMDKAYQQLQDLVNDPDATDEEKQNAAFVYQTAKTLVDTLQQQTDKYKKQIAEGEKEIAANEALIAEVEAQLANNAEVIAQTESQIREAESELQAGKEQYETAKQDALDELDDALAKLEETQKQINEMEIPDWYVLDRSYIESYQSFSSDADSIAALGTVFPLIFFLVAALVSLTTMTRMVEEERTQIGTIKALGYGNRAIIGKYILYAFLASGLGSVIGVALGEYTIPKLIIRAYTMSYYNLTEMLVNINWFYGIIALLMAVICTCAAAFAACRRSLKSSPAILMRPESPKSGKRVLLERFKFIWIRLNFSQKATWRNLMRYKRRFFMTLFGVGGCMALLLVGFGIRDSVSSMAELQYGSVFKFDGIVSIDGTMTRAGRRALITDMADITDITENLQANRTMIYATKEKDKIDDEKYAYLIVPINTDSFPEYINLNEGLTLGDGGVIITEKYAQILDVSVGDSIFIRTSESDAYTKEVAVTGITENYIFNYVYMTPGLYQSLYSTAADQNVVFIKTAEAADMKDLSERLLKIDGVNAVTMNEDSLSDMKQVTQRLSFIVIIMIFSAALLAFVVLYNLNNINITERRRELATIKLLGFYDGELSSYVYRETTVLTVFGTALGIGLGILLHRFVMRTVETDVYMFSKILEPRSILISAGITIAFSLLVNAVMYFKLKKIDMVESLKSVE